MAALIISFFHFSIDEIRNLFGRIDNFPTNPLAFNSALSPPISEGSICNPKIISHFCFGKYCHSIYFRQFPSVHTINIRKKSTKVKVFYTKSEKY